MQPNPYLVIEQIEKAATRQEIDSLLDKLVEIGKPAIIAILEKMPGLVTSRLHLIGAELFARLGYPTNAAALTFMVSDASNPNSSTWKISQAAVLDIGPTALPEIAATLEFCKRDVEFYNIEIETIEDLEKMIRDNQAAHTS
ncbi:MAG: hypothetical protein CVU44_17990 [Chloroflexi bacterium HGW-Chloroflexi-6]|nr:MAG: hypothetical protein CVU44_17990 [Chloroflexi bacterium HGW-Chloroflexi-6]